MREIIFRGKRVDNGEWVEGVPTWDESDAIPKLLMVSNVEKWPFGNAYVDPETVGQFTGLKDKNGNKIFEGDIFNLGDMNILYIVLWHDVGFKGKQICSTSYVGLDYWKDRIELIGNIHDNPELLT